MQLETLNYNNSPIVTKTLLLKLCYFEQNKNVPQQMRMAQNYSQHKSTVRPPRIPVTFLIQNFEFLLHKRYLLLV